MHKGQKMFGPRAITPNLRSVTSGLTRLSFFNTSAQLSLYKEEDKPERAARKLKEWRHQPPEEHSFLTMFQSKRKPKELQPVLKPVNLAPIELKQWWNSQSINYTKVSQRFILQRHKTLGCDLAAAHFLVHRNGKVKFLGQDEWIQKSEDGSYTKLPIKFDPYWQLTHIDATGIELYYEGICNFINLGQVKWASFKGNPHFDDWCLDKIIAQTPKLEYFDISECQSLTERGLGAIYKLYNLKTLIVTDWNKVPSFELTCVMLQDLNPELIIEIKEPEKSKK